MRVILRQRHPRLGFPGEVVLVKRGRGRVLIRQGIAVYATEENKRMIEKLVAQNRADARRAEKRDEHALGVAAEKESADAAAAESNEDERFWLEISRHIASYRLVLTRKPSEHAAAPVTALFAPPGAVGGATGGVVAHPIPLRLIYSYAARRFPILTRKNLHLPAQSGVNTSTPGSEPMIERFGSYKVDVTLPGHKDPVQFTVEVKQPEEAKPREGATADAPAATM